jgi:hypothetical protein
MSTATANINVSDIGYRPSDYDASLYRDLDAVVNMAQTQSTVGVSGGATPSFDYSPKNAEVPSQLSSVTPDQAVASQGFIDQVVSGALKNPDGTVNFGTAATLAQLLGRTGLLNPQTSAVIGQAMQQLNQKDTTGAIASFVSAMSGGDPTISKLANGGDLINDVVQLANNKNSSSSDWTSAGLRAADLLGLNNGTKKLISAVPAAIQAFQAVDNGSGKDALGAASGVIKALVPGDAGAIASTLLDTVAGKPLDYGNAASTALRVAGLDAGAAEAIGGGVKLLQSGNLNVANVAGAAGGIATALGAPKEVGAAASIAQGLAAGGVSGYGMVAAAIGQLIGGKVGHWIGKAGAYAAAAASGPVGWAAGVAMAVLDIFGVRPPREALLPTLNTAYMGRDENGKLVPRIITQTGGQDEQNFSVKNANQTIVQKPEWNRPPVNHHGAWIGHTTGDETALKPGEILYSEADKDGIPDARMMIDQEAGGVIVQEGEEKKTFVTDPNGSEVQRRTISRSELEKLSEGSGDSDSRHGNVGGLANFDIPEDKKDIWEKTRDSEGNWSITETVRGHFKIETEWTTTARFATGAPKDSVVTVNQQTGQMELWAKAADVVPGVSKQEAENGYVRFWHSTGGEPPTEGKAAVLRLKDDGNLVTAEVDAHGGSGYEENQCLTSKSDKGFFSLGAKYSDDNHGETDGTDVVIVDREGKQIDDDELDLGYLDRTDQIARTIQRGALTDIVIKPEEGDEIVLVDNGKGQLVKTSMDEYEATV